MVEKRDAGSKQVSYRAVVNAAAADLYALVANPQRQRHPGNIAAIAIEIRVIRRRPGIYSRAARG